MNHGDGEYLICEKHNTWSWKKGDYCDECKVEQLEAENAALRDDVAGWKHEADGYRKNRDMLSAENAALKAQVAEYATEARRQMNHVAVLDQKLAAAQKDAERIEWLQKHDHCFYNIDKISAIVGNGFSYDMYKSRTDDLRTAIDAAIAKEVGHE